MKNIILLILTSLLVLTVSSCYPVCKLNKSCVRIVYYNNEVYTARGLTNKCMCSFTCDSTLYLDDIICPLDVTLGMPSGNITPHVNTYY